MATMSAFDQFKQHLTPGKVYHRSDLAEWSKAIDRHLSQAVKEGSLRRESAGVYSAPYTSAFGGVPAKDEELIGTFLNGGPFLVTSPSDYNMLGLGTTQLHNYTVVYNRKRSGLFKLGNRAFEFRRKGEFPDRLTREFLLVDLVDNLERSGENRESLRDRIAQKIGTVDRARLEQAMKAYGSPGTRRFFLKALAAGDGMKAGGSAGKAHAARVSS